MASCAATVTKDFTQSPRLTLHNTLWCIKLDHSSRHQQQHVWHNTAALQAGCGDDL